MTYTSNSPVDKGAVFANITKKMVEVYTAKNHDYGDAFGKSVDEFGIIAAVVRMNDKMERIKSLTKLNHSDQMIKDESLEDTLLDLANYAVMTLVQLRA